MVLTGSMPWLLKTDYNLLLNSRTKCVMQEVVEYFVFSAICRALSALVPACFQKLPFLISLAFTLDHLHVWLAAMGGMVQMTVISSKVSLFLNIFAFHQGSYWLRWSLIKWQERSCQDQFIVYLLAMNVIQKLPFGFDELHFGTF